MHESQPDRTTTANPYAVRASSASLEDELTRELIQANQEVYEPASFEMTALRWFAICLISAAPSFLLGLGVTNYRVAGMVVGILIFCIGYTLADYLTARRAWRAIKIVRRTLKTMYATRIAITVLFPVGYLLDLFCGSMSIAVTETITGKQFMNDEMSASFAEILFTTLVQGTILNLVLAIYGMIVLLVLFVVHAIQS